MSKQKTIGFNALMNVIYKASSVVFPLIWFPYVTRVMSQAELGRVQFAISFTEYFTMFASMGIPVYGVTACARVRKNYLLCRKTAWELLLIQLCMSAASCLIFAIIIFTIPKLREEPALFRLQLVSVALSAINMEWLLEATEQYDAIAVRSVFVRLLTTVAMFLLIRSEGDYLVYAMILLGNTASTYIISLLRVREYLRFPSWKTLNLRLHIKQVLVFFGQSAAITLYLNMDSVMLGFLRTETELGLYTGAIKIKLILANLVAALGAVLLPRMSLWFNSGKRTEALAVVGRAAHYVSLLSLAAVVFLLTDTKECILLALGDRYLPAVPSMRLLGATAVFIGLSQVTGYGLLVPTGHAEKVLLSVVVGMVCNLLLNALLIPGYGIEGAAAATLATELAVLAVQVVSVRKLGLKVRLFPTLIVRLIIAAAAGTGTMLLSMRLSLEAPLLVKLLMHGIAFVGGYLLALLILREPALREAVRWLGHRGNDGK